MLHITDETKQEMHRLRASGMIIREIAEATGYKEPTVYRILTGRKTYPCISCGGQSTNPKSKCRACYDKILAKQKIVRQCCDCKRDVVRGSVRCHRCELRRRYGKLKTDCKRSSQKNAGIVPTKRCTMCGCKLNPKNKSGLCKPCYLHANAFSETVIYQPISEPKRCVCGAMIITDNCVACDAREAKFKRRKQNAS